MSTVARLCRAITGPTLDRGHGSGRSRPKSPWSRTRLNRATFAVRCSTLPAKCSTRPSAHRVNETLVHRGNAVGAGGYTVSPPISLVLGLLKVVATYCGGGVFGMYPCGPTAASPGLSLRQQPFTMSPSGRYTWPWYGNSFVSACVLSRHFPFVMVAVSPPPLPLAGLPCHDHWPSTYMNFPIQYLSPSLMPRVRAAVSPNWKLHRGLLPKHTMSGTCVGCAGGAVCCLPVGEGPFCPNGL